jgi:uncharacterized protein YjbJ (UPF0337 family)
MSWDAPATLTPDVAFGAHMWDLQTRSQRKIERATASSALALTPRTACRGRVESNRKESAMNWDRVEGNWKQFAGKVKEKWGKLTDDDITVINGKQDQLVGRIQERYGVAKDEAEKQVRTWAGGL